MDTARGMMLGFGILTVAVAQKGLRRGEKWALETLALSGMASGVPLWTVTGLYFQKGLYEGLSGISLGIWLTLLFYVPWGTGMILSVLWRRRARKLEQA